MPIAAEDPGAAARSCELRRAGVFILYCYRAAASTCRAPSRYAASHVESLGPETHLVLLDELQARVVIRTLLGNARVPRRLHAQRGRVRDRVSTRHGKIGTHASHATSFSLSRVMRCVCANSPWSRGTRSISSSSASSQRSRSRSPRRPPSSRSSAAQPRPSERPVRASWLRAGLAHTTHAGRDSSGLKTRSALIGILARLESPGTVVTSSDL